MPDAEECSPSWLLLSTAAAMNLQRQLDAFRRNQMAVQLASKAAAEKKAVAELAKQRKEQEAQLKAQQNAAAIQAVPVSGHTGAPPLREVA